MSKILILLFFGYLMYEYLWKPVFIQGSSNKRERRVNDDRSEGVNINFKQKKSAQKEFDSGEYIDFEEVED